MVVMVVGREKRDQGGGVCAAFCDVVLNTTACPYYHHPAYTMKRHNCTQRRMTERKYMWGAGDFKTSAPPLRAKMRAWRFPMVVSVWYLRFIVQWRGNEARADMRISSQRIWWRIIPQSDYLLFSLPKIPARLKMARDERGVLLVTEIYQACWAWSMKLLWKWRYRATMPFSSSADSNYK